MRWLLVLVLLLGLFLTGGNVILPPKAWAEMSSVSALYRVEVGTGEALVNGITYALAAGDDIYVRDTDQVSVDPRSRAVLLFRGGAESTLCADTVLDIGPLRSGGRPVAPSANLTLRQGYMINRTATTSPAFSDLDLSVLGDRGFATNEGAAVFAVARRGVEATEGEVFLNDEPVRLSRGRVGLWRLRGRRPRRHADADPVAHAHPHADTHPDADAHAHTDDDHHDAARPLRPGPPGRRPPRPARRRPPPRRLRR